MTRTPVPSNFRSDNLVASERQVAYIRALIDERNLFASPKHFDAVNAMDAGEYAIFINDLKKKAETLNRTQASKWIGALTAFPKKDEAKTSHKRYENVPDGHYALEMPEDEDNPIHFYRINTGKEGTKWEGFQFVDRYSSDDLYPVKGGQRNMVMGRLAEDPKAAAVLYGHETERCCLCHRKLTRADSREAGIGPVCSAGAGW